MNKHTNTNKGPKKKRADYGETPVVIITGAVPKADVRQALKTQKEDSVSLLEAPEFKRRPDGLRERILAADSLGEVDSLYLQGNQFKQASEKTIRRWRRAATLRRRQLQQAVTA